MYFEKNAEALRAIDPAHHGLLAQIQQAPHLPETDLVLCQTSDGNYTLQYRDVLLHDLENPVKEAYRAFKTSCKSGEDRVHLLLGLGLGYALDETYKNSPGQIVVYEPDSALLRFILENVDLSEMLASGRVRIASTHFDLLSFLRPRIYSDYELDILILPSSATLMAAEIPVLVQKMKALIMDWARDYRTVHRFHEQWMAHFFHNLPSLAATPTVDTLQNRFPDKPAIIISRGPSLDASLEALGQLADAAVLVAVGSAVRRLWEAGITPDFAVFYDANGMQEQVHGIPASHLEKITFVLCPSSPPCGFEMPSRGKVVFFSHNGKQMCDWLDQSLGQKHVRLEGGGTVSLIAMQLALMMGCGPIILVGQDLAFPNNQVYAGGIALQTDKQGNMALPATETLYAELESMTTVQGQQGESLPALSAYAGFIRHFESLAVKIAASTHPVALYNASIGGARIEGYTLKPLSDFVGTFPAWRNSSFALEAIPSLTPAQIHEKRGKLKSALHKLQTDLNETIGLCHELRFEVPGAKDVTPEQLEDRLWEATQRLFRQVQAKPFVSFLAMFELIPYKQRFKAFASAESFNPALRDDLLVVLERCVAILQETFLPWVVQATEQLDSSYHNASPPLSAKQQPITTA